MQFRINRKIILITAAIFILSMVLNGCNASKEDSVAIVNGKIISKSEFGINFDINKKMYENQLGSDIMSKDMGKGKTFEEELKQVVLDNLIVENVILQDAEKQKITVKDKEVDEAIDQFIVSVGGKEKLKEFLKQNSMTEDYMEKRMRTEMIIDKYRNHFFESIISDEDVKKQYEENKDSYVSIRASHILVKTEKEANDILKRINSGESFEELTKLSTEPGAEARKGDLGYFTKGKMVPEFEKAVFELKPGEISDVVKTEFGYHIIKLTDIKDSFEEVKDNVLADLQNKESAKFDQKVKELRDNAKIEILMNTEVPKSDEENKAQDSDQDKGQDNTENE
ncbi:peptidylprolyl isomerase [Proteiniborus sp. MB09-C3]|uniref:peptidylprolyl isomerase n=1 Tax=Proteiniborus sp. MB09-C3 TaxID=3050072 RepID=UPI0025559587|nr:peptidylprolyl isomerase [Proteiniborus sp. MB09-C3]WIV13040.1 peptidylprolyl isomerase [Proteiniborus sp. MB09-C3]